MPTGLKSERYRIGLSRTTVSAWDTQKKQMLSYNRHPLRDGIYPLEVQGSVTVKAETIVDVTKSAATTGYVFNSDKGEIVLLRKLNPSWRFPINSGPSIRTNQRSPSLAILKFRTGELALLNREGIYRLIPIKHLKPSENESDGDPVFDLPDDFAP